MEEAEKRWVEGVQETLSDLQAARIAQATLIEAMVISHPNPRGLREAWDRLAAARIADTAGKKAYSDHAKRTNEDLLYYFQNWTQKLEGYHPR
ncbi:hypothetical protein ACTT2I_05215 [Stenotrophomonas sp. PUT21]|uniref:hypothetical protein n=1 Tax=Stenotrophomonas sp. PUT21 TaxID=3456954 RepID=UPI003FCDACAE